MTATEVIAEPGQHNIIMTREFDAPPSAIFRAYTDPDLIVQWLGPRDLKMRIEAYDMRHGGSYRYIHADNNGNEYGFRGVVHGTPSVEDGITQTFEFEGMPGHVSLDKAIFEPLPGNRTRLRLESVFQSVEDRDGMIASGMEGGVTEGFEKLDELLARM